MFKFILNIITICLISCSNLVAKPTNEISKLEHSVENFINGIKCIYSEFIQINPDGVGFSGKFYLDKGKTPRMRVEYEKNAGQRIFVNGKKILIINTKDNSRQSYNIKDTPIYVILENGLNLSKELHSTKISPDGYVYVKIRRPQTAGEMSFTLVFSRYKNGNVKYLEGWFIDDPSGNRITFGFTTSSLSYNDKSKIPPKVFEESFKIKDN